MAGVDELGKKIIYQLLASTQFSTVLLIIIPDIQSPIETALGKT